MKQKDKGLEAIKEALNCTMICSPFFERMLYYNHNTDEYEYEGKILDSNDERLIKFKNMKK